MRTFFFGALLMLCAATMFTSADTAYPALLTISAQGAHAVARFDANAKQITLKITDPKGTVKVFVIDGQPNANKWLVVQPLDSLDNYGAPAFAVISVACPMHCYRNEDIYTADFVNHQPYAPAPSYLRMVYNPTLQAGAPVLITGVTPVSFATRDQSNLYLVASKSCGGLYGGSINILAYEPRDVSAANQDNFLPGRRPFAGDTIYVSNSSGRLEFRFGKRLTECPKLSE